MADFKIKIADKVIEIESIYDRVYEMCSDYIVRDCEADFKVVSTQSAIDYESELDSEGILVSDLYRETLSVYRLICEKMLDYSTFLMHGSVVGVGDMAFMFTAKSSVGKTTRTNMFLDQIESSYVVNGDKPLLKVGEDCIYACGTPWSGKENLNTNTMVPLKAILFLERDEKTSLEKIPFSQAFITLYQQIYRPSNPVLMAKTLSLIKAMENKVDFYSYHMNLVDTDLQAIYDKIK